MHLLPILLTLLFPLSHASQSPHFVLTSFEAFIPNAAYPTLFSRTAFNLFLMHPDPVQQWRTTCMTHTAGELCDTTAWTACEPVEGAGNEDDSVSFRFSEGVGTVELKRVWTYVSPGPSGQTMHMTTMASEDANWLSGKGGNVTDSAYGRLYNRSAAWEFPWKSTVG